jgi:hypothetical protein
MQECLKKETRGINAGQNPLSSLSSRLRFCTSLQALTMRTLHL